MKHDNRTYCMKPHASVRVSLQNDYQLMQSTQNYGTIGQLELTYLPVKTSLSIY